ncbi:MAG: VC0807 family protein [Solirubrobacteraceae bacterium]
MTPPPQRGSATALAVDLLAPIGIYYGLRFSGIGLYPAVLAAAVAPGVGAVIGVMRRGRIEPLAALSLTALAVGLVLSLAGGGPRLLLAKEGWVTAITGVWFLASTRGSRPLALLLTRPFLPHGRWGFTEDWDALWEREPLFRRIWRTSSVIWGVGTIADSVVRVVISYTLPIDAVPAAGTALYLATSALLIIATNVYYAHAGLWAMLRPSPRAGPPTTTAGGSAPPSPLHLPS